MPTTVNGIGTHYYGQRNLLTRSGTCEFCGHFGPLKSYDTTLFFVVLFLPLLPLGQKRVLSECPACHRHQVVPLKKWQESKRKDIDEAVAAWRAAPQDPAAAERILGLVVFYQDRRVFLEGAPHLRQLMAARPEILIQLAQAYEFFSLLPEAEEVWRAALALDARPPTREALALNLVKQRRPADAEPLLEHVVKHVTKENVSWLYVLVEGYQAVAQHRRALELLDLAAAALPDQARDKGWKRYRKASEKNQARGKPVVSAALAQFGKAPGVERAWTFSFSITLARLLLAAVLLGGAALYLWLCFRPRPVYFVNGTDRAYPVLLDGGTRSVELRPGWELVSVRGPQVTWQLTGKPVPEGQEAHPIAPAAWWKRPFSRRTFVANPDGAALILWEQATYAAQREDAAPTTFKLHAGATFYEFRGIDYPFADFPDEIQLSSESAKVRKERLADVSRLGPTVALAVLLKENDQAAAVRYLRNRLHFVPDDLAALYAFVNLEKPEAALAVLRPRLAERPVLIEWHRAYQSLAERATPDHDLAAEYRVRADAEPGNRALLYLAGRAAATPDAAEAFYAQAAQEPDPCVYAFNAIAYARLAAGRFPEALAAAREAVARAPDVEVFQITLQDALLATGGFAERLAAVEEARRKQPGLGMLAAEEIMLRLRLGQPTDARRVAEQYVKRLGLDPEQKDAAPQWAAYFTGLEAYLGGNEAGFAREMVKVEEEDAQFAGHLSAGELDDAARLLTKMARPSAYQQLQFWLAAALAGKAERGTAAFAAAVTTLGKGSREERLVGDCLAGRRPTDAALLARLPMDVREKALYLTVLGLRSPQGRAELHALARQLNFDTRYPHRLLLRALASPPPAPRT